MWWLLDPHPHEMALSSAVTEPSEPDLPNRDPCYPQDSHSETALRQGPRAPFPQVTAAAEPGACLPVSRRLGSKGSRFRCVSTCVSPPVLRVLAAEVCSPYLCAWTLHVSKVSAVTSLHLGSLYKHLCKSLSSEETGPYHLLRRKDASHHHNGCFGANPREQWLSSCGLSPLLSYYYWGPQRAILRRLYLLIVTTIFKILINSL